ncbi:MAG: tetratricopeptide repeat protein [Pirellulaceae bacterium]|nr:tetratricopeptide repeat protein [Pirellulaceae bacterium]
MILRLSISLIGTTLLLVSSGCVTTPGARSSIWPTKAVNDPTAMGGNTQTSSITSALGGTVKGVKGQFTNVGTAVSSAYGKAKTVVSSAFVPAPTSSVSSDATTLANDPLNPTLGPEINVITGQMYEKNGQYAKAMDHYSKALEIDAKNISALSSLAQLHEKQNNNAKAIEYYQKALVAAPQQSQLYSELGSVYAKMGQNGAAKEQYQKAINLDPKNRSHRSSMAGILIDEGQAVQAEQELRQVDAPALANYQMAYLYMSRQNLPAARQYLLNSLSIDPNLQPARDMLNSLGGPQLAQQANGAMQQASQLYQQSNQIYKQVGQLGSSVQNAYAPPTNIPNIATNSPVSPAVSAR